MGEIPVTTIPLSVWEARNFVEAANGGIIRAASIEAAFDFSQRTEPQYANDFHSPVRIRSAGRMSRLLIRLHESDRKQDPLRTGLGLACTNENGEFTDCPHKAQIEAFAEEIKERNLIAIPEESE
jgi:hypothetical protein